MKKKKLKKKGKENDCILWLYDKPQPDGNG